MTRASLAAKSRKLLAQSKLLHLAVLAGAGVVFSLPTLLAGFPSYTHDGWIHALWYSNFANQLWAGELYPRWLLGLNRGLGSPALFFYPPAPYYAASLFKPFLHADAQGLRQLGMAALLAVIASGWSMYLWLCRSVPRRPALLAALVYLAMPYHLAVDLYLRGAFAEVWAFVWLPLILFFAQRLKCGARLSAAGLAVSYALLIVSHLPTALIFSPVPILYLAVVPAAARRIRTTAAAVAALALGSGLAALYLLPALAMREFISMQELSRPEVYFENWFVLTSFFVRKLPAYLSWLALSMVGGAACAYLLAGTPQSETLRRERAFWAALVPGAVVLMTPLSKPVWRLLPLLQNIQFPFRFNTILCIATAALIALALASPGQALALRTTAPRLAILLLVLLWVLIDQRVAWSEYKVPPVRRAEHWKLFENNQDAPEYRPRWAEREAFYRLLAEPRQAQPVDQVSVVASNAAVTLERWAPRNISLRVSSANGAVLRLKQLYFPGWRARVEGGGALEVRPAVPAGLLEVTVPGGARRVQLELTPGWAERWGQYVSAVSLLLVLALIVRGLVFSKSSGMRAATWVELTSRTQ